MQLMIKLPEILPDDMTVQLIINKLEDILGKDVFSYEIQKNEDNSDPWDNLDIDKISVDTGIADFAKNHDHYLYGTPKIS
ncbi:MAG: hypothetical protein HQK65_14955 [Desulfamplus sp.]|nr:hypothetical protein [Desulfamplus sp.]